MFYRVKEEEEEQYPQILQYGEFDGMDGFIDDPLSIIMDRRNNGRQTWSQSTNGSWVHDEELQTITFWIPLIIFMKMMVDRMLSSLAVVDDDEC